MDRRIACLADPERFLRTYFKPIFYNPFASHHRAMIDAIWQRALTGGDKAVAAPRGDGKSQVTIGMTVYVMLATAIRFPVMIAATSKKAKKLFSQIKSKFANASKFAEFHGDFPEITACVDALEGAPQRAAKQHVDGQPTGIVWSQDLIVLPTVPPQPWGSTDWGGKRCVYFGLDSAIRGEGFEESRPDMAIVDDPETREVAFSPTDKHRDVEEMINGDVAGLAGPDKTIRRVVLTTIQNRRCYSWRVTDRKAYPNFAGDRYALLKTWPENRERWEEYVSLRQRGQADGDKNGTAATAFYLEHAEEMQSGAELTNPNRFVSETDENGDPIEVDALQAFFNRVADWGLPRVLAELQQEPEEEETEQTIGLTAGIVQNRMSGLYRHEMPKEDCRITVGIDIGKYYSHWVKAAFWGNAIGVVTDYGVMETPGMNTATDAQSVQIALLNSLLAWSQEIQDNGKPELVFVDSGDYTDAVYEFCRRSGNLQFKPSKGNDGRMRFSSNEGNTATTNYFHECRADYQANAGLFLFHVNVGYWKNEVQRRFLVDTFDDGNMRNEGTLSLFVPTSQKEHHSFAHHMVSEELQELFIEGKGLQRRWVQKSKNNHWLDAMALALAAAGVLGIREVPQMALPQSNASQPNRPSAKPPSQQPQRFKQRAGGWIPKRRW